MSTEQRIAELERRCRFLSRTVTVLVVVAGLALLLGAQRLAAPEKLQVTELEVVDAKGNVRIRLGKLDAGEFDVYGAKLSDAAGNQGALISDFSQLTLQKGDGGIALVARDDGASLQLSARGLRPRAMLYANENHSGLQLRDTHGEVGFIQETDRITVPGERRSDPFAPQ